MGRLRNGVQLSISGCTLNVGSLRVWATVLHSINNRGTAKAGGKPGDYTWSELRRISYTAPLGSRGGVLTFRVKEAEVGSLAYLLPGLRLAASDCEFRPVLDRGICSGHLSLPLA
jgi:hypothetical protein